MKIQASSLLPEEYKKSDYYDSMVEHAKCELAFKIAEDVLKNELFTIEIIDKDSEYYYNQYKTEIRLTGFFIKEENLRDVIKVLRHLKSTTNSAAVSIELNEVIDKLINK